MGKKGNEVYKNANKEFDEQIELYCRKTKSNTRKIKILSSISVVIFHHSNQSIKTFKKLFQLFQEYTQKLQTQNIIKTGKKNMNLNTRTAD